MARKVRIGIDVGGTFTDAVAVDAQTFELLGAVKVPTTHTSSDGVARGIIDALDRLLHEVGLAASDVQFIAHGTTQATNALLEGDVAQVGIVGIGEGLEGMRARSETAIAPIELAPGRKLAPLHTFISTRGVDAQAGPAVRELTAGGARVIVAAAAYSVDDPSSEIAVMEAAAAQSMPATGTHEISKLYGLRTRTRTAAINASILPRMLETVDRTERAVKNAEITAPLMIMRCDGGVMDVPAVRRRPILTVLSGPAAGVAGALMSEHVSNGIFLEIGGTSTDISAIRNGRVAVSYSHIGGHPTFLRSLDVRTLGIAGGSMIRVRDGKITGVGPRSAHIAGLHYSVYAGAEATRDARLASIQPAEGDPDDYAVVDCAGGRFALTVSCAANILGVVGAHDYAFADPAAARNAFAPLAAALGTDLEGAARAVLQAAIVPVVATVEELMSEYDLDRSGAVLVGGGGAGATIVPFLAREMGLEHRIARHAEVISPIGVALALLRESVERVIPNATPADVQRVRDEAEAAVIAIGANPETVDVEIEYDARRNVVRATAVGATELRTRDLRDAQVDEPDARAAAAQSLQTAPDQLDLAAETASFRVYRSTVKPRGFLGRFARPKHPVRVVDRQGVVRLRLRDGAVEAAPAASAPDVLAQMVDKFSAYGEGGVRLPAAYVIVNHKIIDLSGLPRADQIVSMARSQTQAIDAARDAVLLVDVPA